MRHGWLRVALWRHAVFLSLKAGAAHVTNKAQIMAIMRAVKIGIEKWRLSPRHLRRQNLFS